MTETNRWPDDAATSEVGHVTAPYIAASLQSLIVPIDSVRPMRSNARWHDERNLAAITASLRAHGQQRPLVVARTFRDTERAIVAGCATWTCARALGWRWIAVAWFEGSDSDAARFSVADNRSGELASWNTDALTALSSDADLDLLALGWNATELGDLFRGTDAKPLRFEPIEPEYRLDQLTADTVCPNCGHRFHREAV